MSDPYSPVRAVLETDPYTALVTLDSLDGTHGQSATSMSLRARALYLLGLQHSQSGDPGDALTCWEQASALGDATAAADCLRAAEDLCERTATAWMNGGYQEEARALVRRGLALGRTPRLTALDGRLNPRVAPPAAAPPRRVPTPPRATAPASQAGPSRAAAGASTMGSTLRTVAFNSLPAGARRRFSECTAGRGTPAALHYVPSGGLGGPIFLCLLGVAVVAILIVAGFGDLGGSSYDSPGMLVGYGLFTFAALAGLLGGIGQYFTRKTMPYREGTYLFPSGIVKADAKGQLALFPMGILSDYKCVHHYTNGVYSQSVMRFAFDDNKAWQVLNVRPLKKAEEVAGRLAQSLRDRSVAIEMRDLDTLVGMDPLAAPADSGRESGPEAPAPPVWVRWHAAIALALAVVLAPLIWVARNVASDASAWSNTQRIGTEGEYKRYAVVGWLHKAEAQKALPGIAFREAKHAGTVTALRKVIHDYPQSEVVPQARQEIARIYDVGRAKFHTKAILADAKMLALVDRMLDYLIAHDNPAVEVRFSMPDAAALAAEDRRLGRQLYESHRMAPIAPHFTPESSKGREAAIVDRLSKGFGAIFPQDVLTLRMGPRMAAGAVAPTDVPIFLIDYDVVPSGSVYTSQTNPLSAAFVGIHVNFAVSMHVPGTPEPFAFKLDVAPPHEFQVEYTRTSPTGIGEGPTEGRVYEVMAERAFDELTTKLGTVFFPEPKAAAPKPR